LAEPLDADAAEGIHDVAAADAVGKQIRRYTATS